MARRRKRKFVLIVNYRRKMRLRDSTIRKRAVALNVLGSVAEGVLERSLCIPQKKNMTASPDRMEWFIYDRFGISFHWGLYAIPARGEWVRSVERMTIEEHQPYFDSFNPVRFDPRDWARRCRRAGLKYAILTAKHHDGFCLFDSALTTYSSLHTPCRRDLVREFLDAFRAEGLRVGLYYSLLDWHHPDYPAWQDRQHPMRDNPAYRDQQVNWENYVEYMHGQVRELCGNYGKLDLFFFDFSYNEFRGEKWKATELVEMMRSLQPDVILNDRLGGDIKSDRPAPYAGDFDSPELNIPLEPVANARGEEVPWEAWANLNNNWSYHAADLHWKTSEDIIRYLVNCVSKNGNLMINIGPDPLGQLPPEACAILEEVGQWMDRFGESIYGCGAAALPRPDWGRWTAKGKNLYAQIHEPVMGHIPLPGMKGKIDHARFVDTGSEAILTPFWNEGVQRFGDSDDIYANISLPPQHTFPQKRSIDRVMRLHML